MADVRLKPRRCGRVATAFGIDACQRSKNEEPANVTRFMTRNRRGPCWQRRRASCHQAEKVRTRLLNQLDEQRHPRTKATVNQLMDRYLSVLDVAQTTRPGYVSIIDKHIRPVLGELQVARVNGEVLDSFYAELRRCRA